MSDLNNSGVFDLERLHDQYMAGGLSDDVAARCFKFSGLDDEKAAEQLALWSTERQVKRQADGSAPVDDNQGQATGSSAVDDTQKQNAGVAAAVNSGALNDNFLASAAVMMRSLARGVPVSDAAVSFWSSFSPAMGGRLFAPVVSAVSNRLVRLLSAKGRDVDRVIDDPGMAPGSDLDRAALDSATPEAAEAAFRYIDSNPADGVSADRDPSEWTALAGRASRPGRRVTRVGRAVGYYDALLDRYDDVVARIRKLHPDLDADAVNRMAADEVKGDEAYQKALDDYNSYARGTLAGGEMTPEMYVETLGINPNTELYSKALAVADYLHTSLNLPFYGGGSPERYDDYASRYDRTPASGSVDMYFRPKGGKVDKSFINRQLEMMLRGSMPDVLDVRDTAFSRALADSGAAAVRDAGRIPDEYSQMYYNTRRPAPKGFDRLVAYVDSLDSNGNLSPTDKLADIFAKADRLEAEFPHTAPLIEGAKRDLSKFKGDMPSVDKKIRRTYDALAAALVRSNDGMVPDTLTDADVADEYIRGMNSKPSKGGDWFKDAFSPDKDVRVAMGALSKPDRITADNVAALIDAVTSLPGWRSNATDKDKESMDVMDARLGVIDDEVSAGNTTAADKRPELLDMAAEIISMAQGYMGGDDDGDSDDGSYADMAPGFSAAWDADDRDRLEAAQRDKISRMAGRADAADAFGDRHDPAYFGEAPSHVDQEQTFGTTRFRVPEYVQAVLAKYPGSHLKEGSEHIVVFPAGSVPMLAETASKEWIMSHGDDPSPEPLSLPKSTDSRGRLRDVTGLYDDSTYGATVERSGPLQKLMLNNVDSAADRLADAVAARLADYGVKNAKDSSRFKSVDDSADYYDVVYRFPLGSTISNKALADANSRYLEVEIMYDYRKADPDVVGVHTDKQLSAALSKRENQTGELAATAGGRYADLVPGAGRKAKAHGRTSFSDSDSVSFDDLDALFSSLNVRPVLSGAFTRPYSDRRLWPDWAVCYLSVVGANDPGSYSKQNPYNIASDKFYLDMQAMFEDNEAGVVDELVSRVKPLMDKAAKATQGIADYYGTRSVFPAERHKNETDAELLDKYKAARADLESTPHSHTDDPSGLYRKVDDIVRQFDERRKRDSVKPADGRPDLSYGTRFTTDFSPSDWDMFHKEEGEAEPLDASNEEHVKNAEAHNKALARAHDAHLIGLRDPDDFRPADPAKFAREYRGIAVDEWRRYLDARESGGVSIRDLPGDVSRYLLRMAGVTVSTRDGKRRVSQAGLLQATSVPTADEVAAAIDRFADRVTTSDDDKRERRPRSKSDRGGRKPAAPDAFQGM